MSSPRSSPRLGPRGKKPAQVAPLALPGGWIAIPILVFSSIEGFRLFKIPGSQICGRACSAVSTLSALRWCSCLSGFQDLRPHRYSCSTVTRGNSQNASFDPSSTGPSKLHGDRSQPSASLAPADAGCVQDAAPSGVQLTEVQPNEANSTKVHKMFQIISNASLFFACGDTLPS